MAGTRLIVALVVGASALAAAGTTLLWSGDDGPVHAAPRDGDRGVYRISLGAGWPEHLDGNEFDLLEFNRSGQQAIRAGDGVVRALDRTTLDGYAVGSSYWSRVTRNEWADPATGAVLAYGRIANSTQVGGSVQIEPWMQYDKTQEVRSFTFPAHGERDCLLASPLAGRDGWPDRVALGPCLVPFLGLTLAEGFTLHRTSLTLVNGTEAMGYWGEQLGTDRQTVHLQAWYSPASPYPLRVRFEQVVDDFGLRVAILNLADFEPGSQPLGMAAAVEPDPAPVLAFAPRAPWGIPEDRLGIDHPFPLSEAYAEAMASTRYGLADWLEAHPDAYPRSAHLRTSEQIQGPQGDRYWTWTLELSDGPSYLRLDVVRHWIYTEAGPVPIPDQPLRDALDTLNGGLRFEGESETVIPPSAVPSDWPTLASMVDRWAAYGESMVPRDDLRGWSFRVVCDEPCTTTATLALALDFGDITYSYDPTTNSPMGGDRDERSSGLAMDGTGTVSAFSASKQLSDEKFGLLARPTAASAAPAPSQDPMVERATVAAGAGLAAAALVALALAALKASPWALFSRIEAPRLAHHPARAAILQAVAAEPGIHFMALQRRLGQSNGQLVHHLRKLVDADLVLERRSGGYTCYFGKGTGAAAVRSAPLIRSAGARAVLSALAQHPGSSLRGVARVSGLDPSTAHYHVLRLSEAGLVLREGPGLALSPAGREATVTADAA